MSRGYKLYFAFGIALAAYTGLGMLAFHTTYVSIRLIEGEKTSVTFFRFFDEKLVLGTTFPGYRRRETDDPGVSIASADATRIEIGVSSGNEEFQRYRAMPKINGEFDRVSARILVAMNGEEENPTSPDKKAKTRFSAGINTLHFMILRVGRNVEGNDIDIVIPASLGVKEGDPRLGFCIFRYFGQYIALSIAVFGRGGLRKS